MIRCGLVGKKLGQSFSPQIHAQIGGYSYELFPLATSGELRTFLQKKTFHGLNVTMPYKREVMPYLDEISDLAKEIGAVNTILHRADGSLFGDNTDYYGILAMAEQAGISFVNKKVLILGSGGTAATAVAAAKHNGARDVKVVSRNGPLHYGNVYEEADSEIIVHTTPVGMFPHNEGQLLQLERFPRCEGVLDVIYNPLRTRLFLSAVERGIPVSGGLTMLVAQAVKAGELFLGTVLPKDTAARIQKRLLRQLENVVLIGMPGCGKTQVGQALAQELKRPFFDTDCLIEQKASRTIPALFAEEGEAAFRLLEKEMVAKTAQKTGCVIATGGGVVLDPENMRRLRQNGRVYFLQRPLALLSLQGRPLSKDDSAVERLYRERLPLYQKYGDCTVTNHRSISDAVMAIKEDFFENTCD